MEQQVIEERQTRRTREELHLLAVREILRASMAALPLSDILAIIANMTIIAFDATTSWFMLPEDGHLRTAVARGEFAEALAGTVCADPQSPCLVTAGSDRPHILQPRAIDPADPVLGLFARQEEPVVLLPLRSAGRTVGLLGSAVTPEAALDISFLITMAEQAVAAMQSAQQREQIRSWQQRLDTVFEQFAEPVLIFDGAARLALTNTAAEEVLSAADVRVGQTITELVAKAGLTTAQGRPLPPQETAAARALRGERVQNLEEDLPAGEGRVRHLLVSAAPVQWDSRIEGAVVVWRDITERRQAEAERERLLEEARELQMRTARALKAEHRAREQAEAAVRARDDFLAASAHELKTPITNLRGYAQTTMRRLEREEAPDPERTHQALQIIDLQSDRLARLVQQLLDVASIEAGQLELHRRETDLVPLVRDLVEDVQAGTRRHTLTLQAPPSIHAFVDPERIEQVVANLLDNAVKFSPPGTPIEIELVTPSPDTVQLAVRDYGPGIPPELRPQLFGRFFQAQTGRPFAGLGLGLYYSRRIVELHGGRIWAEFPEDGGSRFIVELPRTSGETSPLQDQAPQEGGGPA